MGTSDMRYLFVVDAFKTSQPRLRCFNYGLELQYANKFFYSPEEKESGLLIINRNLENGQPVLVSVFSPNGSHVLVVHGVKRSGGSVVGYYIQDPNGRIRGHNYFLTRQEFLENWRG